MNINCTSKCAYQNDGKCTMDHVPDMAERTFSAAVFPIDADCPYINYELS